MKISTIGMIPIILFVSAGALAGDLDFLCSQKLTSVGALQIKGSWDDQTGNCSISVSPMQTFDLLYRSYYFDTTGLFMVFNSYGYGLNTEDTAARDFYLFPRRQLPQFNASITGNLLVTLASGAVLEFSGESGRVLSLTGAKISEAESVLRDNYGGVEIHDYPGVWIDCGFMVGSSPEGSPNGVSVVHDALGHECTVNNDELFLSGQLLYPTDVELATFLGLRCPELDVSALK